VTGTFAIAFDYGGDTPLCRRPDRAARVAEIVSRACLAGHLRRVCAYRGERWGEHARVNPDAIQRVLMDERNEAASFDSGRRGELTASAEIQSGPMIRPKGPPATRYAAYVVVPYVAEQLGEVISSVGDLAVALDAAAGFVALEPGHGLAHRVATGGSWPKPRVGLSDQRRRERRARHRKAELLGDHVANVEWMTLLGPGHLARISVEALRASGVFFGVVELVPHRLALLRVTADPTDDLSSTSRLEQELDAARAALAPIRMDVSDVTLD
jgi:hypothetical protein